MMPRIAQEDSFSTGLLTRKSDGSQELCVKEEKMHKNNQAIDVRSIA